MSTQDDLNKLLYRAGRTQRPVTSQLGEREPTGAELQAIEAFLAAETYPVVGVDVSNWQGLIDWGKMAERIYFVFIRSSYGAATIDAAYTRNLKEAHARGRAVGLYHYLKPSNDFKKQAGLFYSLYKDSGCQLPPVYDLEENGGLDKNGLNNWMHKFLNTFYELLGVDYTGELYTSAGFFDTNVMTKPTFDWPKYLRWWLASWTAASSPYQPAYFNLVAKPLTWEFWQHTSKLDGLAYGAQSKSLDGNRYNGSLAKFNTTFNMSLKPLGETAPPEPPEPPTPEPAGLQMKVISSGNLNVRKGPGTGYAVVGTIAPGTVVNVLDVGGNNAWVEIEPGKWACVQLNSDKYLQKF